MTGTPGAGVTLLTWALPARLSLGTITDCRCLASNRCPLPDPNHHHAATGMPVPTGVRSRLTLSVSVVASWSDGRELAPPGIGRARKRGGPVRARPGDVPPAGDEAGGRWVG